MYLGYNWLITHKTLPINAFFVNSKLWLQVMFTYQSFFVVLTFLGDIYLSVLWLVISDTVYCFCFAVKKFHGLTSFIP